MHDPLAPSFDPVRIANDIFIAEGGVDDFDEMSDAQLLNIIYRELPTYLALEILEAARRIKREV